MPIARNIIQSDTLVIAATGINFKLALPVDAFLEKAGLNDKSTIIITDRSRRLALGGVSDECPTIFALVEYLRQEIAQLSPGKIVVTGSSGGGYTAMLLGHLLKADHVVAFAPYPYTSRAAFVRQKDPALHTMDRIIESIERLPDSVWKFFDLRQVLSQWNGVTEFYVHASRYHKPDRDRALYLKGLPHVELVLHPYLLHSVPSVLARAGKLQLCYNLPYTREPYSLKAGLLRVGNLTMYWLHKLRGSVRKIR